MENEIWKPIKDYEGLYEVSNMGRVRSLDRGNIDSTGRKQHFKGMILKQGKDNSNYLVVVLSKNGKTKTFRVHRLVAEAFIPNPENKPCVDHINTIRTENEVANLRWATYEENNNNELTNKKQSFYAKNRKHHPMEGKHHTEETKKKLSETNKGEKNPMYGKHRSEETKKKISEAHKGKKKPEGFGKIMSEINSGSNHPKALKLICIYPDGTQTDIMTKKELAEYLRINIATVDKILKSGQPYNPRRGNVKHLKGIKIIKVEEDLF